MGMSLTYKILKNNLLKGELKAGNEIAVKVNQTLTQDSTGTMAYLQLNAMNVDKVVTDISVAYVDHNMLQSSFENADDHEFIKTSAAKHNIVFSKPGNGICHRLHLEKFGKPGKVLIGSDSHTPTGGGLGMIAIGAGGLDVAIGMARGLYYLKVPKVYNIELRGKLKPWVSAKDIILYVLKELTVKGGVGFVMEYTGEGIKSLSVEDRATITNMGAELGATTSIFPSDEITRDFLKKQSRESDFIELLPDADAVYDKKLIVNLDDLVPLAAFPHSPDNVHEIPDEKIKVDQIAIGSCTNSSYSDFMKLAKILDGKKVHPDVSLVLSPGSSNIMKMISENGALAKFIGAGARLLEAACGPCIGMGQAPKSNGISLRTFNRNFKGRCGTMNAEVYLVSTETAAASALTGYLTDPRTLGEEIIIKQPEKFESSENYFIFPSQDENERKNVEIVMGPNIKPFPIGEKLKDTITKKVILKTKDNVTTDDICPSNAGLLPFRSNIPKLSQHCFETIIPDFKERAEKNDGGIIVGGDNYGQGSSREHAALLPLYLGIKAVIAKSFARIHKANLINSGIIPLEFENQSDYDGIDEYDELQLTDVENSLAKGEFTVKNLTKNNEFKAKFNGSARELKILKYGGYLKFAVSDEFLN
ncbi:MAG: aconitate hydratase [Leptotrichia sp.]|uniref:aconitate hydratase n=1 Tax=Leptotrichia sp. oral taxon 498 TaxID=712368 RepID=UPI000B8CF7BB|nr:aconitate hydratase [Leptotrichia sp. oral taxon 498]ASQ47679.1 aconitate hydratase [Leptotrichia sp. oral taxon 498]RKW34540.1 MAG: aconitate hydratase [Leptotrichia sp.]